MSVEAISWALNLAPVPCDRGGKPNPACKSVLIGLANHAAPDGREAFPSVRTLIRYTCLSERTVQTALDRLEADGIIRPCDPAIVAAKIKRADRRPQGWDLAMHLVRGDLDDEDLAALERQFPGLTARVAAARATVDNPAAAAGDTCSAGNGVQLLHPVAERPVDNVTGGVQSLHPVRATGCNCCGNGVQQLRERGAAVAPEPSIEPSREPPAARTGARGSPAAADNRPDPGGGAGEFFTRLGSGWPLTDPQRTRLAPMAAAAIADGWEPAALAAFVGANTAGVRSPAAVLAARLSPAELPPPPGRAVARPPRPPWCGACDERTRRIERADGADAARDAGRCPRCHSLTGSSTGEAGNPAGQAEAGQLPKSAGGGYPSETAVSGTAGSSPAVPVPPGLVPADRVRGLVPVALEAGAMSGGAT